MNTKKRKLQQYLGNTAMTDFFSPSKKRRENDSLTSRKGSSSDSGGFNMIELGECIRFDSKKSTPQKEEVKSVHLPPSIQPLYRQKFDGRGIFLNRTRFYDDKLIKSSPNIISFDQLMHKDPFECEAEKLEI